ncbi:alpha/beta hydrolase [Uliginosibacterium sp. H3]|uniref:Alpha/beta hydrolase n=1 Tax=Uliginosibacterium silvisoli TaxID=3114758 RepID=A0ABU6JZ15_9RHOO|nr:alpha/beta hydrolase [Uliginosibacterium sp. H3]
MNSLRKSKLSPLALIAGMHAFLSPAAVAADGAAAKPVSIVFVHGAWADGSSWNDVIPLLLDKGLTVVSVQNPLSSLADDVAATRRAIDLQPGPVLLVGHSWGGVVITEAGRHEKVAGLVYVAAFGPDEGESVSALLGNKDIPPPAGLGGVYPDATGYLWQKPENIAEHFAQDVSPAQKKLIAATQNPIFAKCFDEKVGAPAWKTKPSWYILAAQDHMIPPAAQKLFATRMNASLTTLDTSHVPMLSKPKDVANAIIAAAAKI